MAKQGASTAIPNLRFPEFREARGWKQSRLGNLGSFIRGLTYAASDVQSQGLLVLRSTNIQNGALVLDKDLAFVGKKCSPDQILQPGDVAICMSNGSKTLVGKSAQFEGNYPAPLTVGAFCSIFRPSLPFARLAFQTERYADFVALAIGGGNINNLRNSDLESFEFEIPESSTEQKKIVDCLTSLDEVIAAQGQKVETLKAHKRGLMQQLFPREGETRPRLRFPAFLDAGEWEEKSLDRLVTIQSGATPSKANSKFWGGSIPWVSAKDMKRLFLEDSEEHISEEAVENGARIVPKGTVLMLTRGMTLLKDVPICMLRREMSFNQDVKGLRPRSRVNGLFLAWMLIGNKDRLLAMVNMAGHGTGKIDTDELKALMLRVPSPKEQQRIADFLSSLDTQIAAESEHLIVLKTHKQGLMRQLFPTPEAASA
jgi:type I restriction enzyme S subunit